MKKLIVLSFASTVILAAAATAQESSSTSGPPKTETAPAISQEVLKKTTHGRAMLARTGKDPEDGRFLRALAASIRHYTDGNR